MNSPQRDRASKFLALGLWLALGLLFATWALLVWHPWIDWFGRPR